MPSGQTYDGNGYMNNWGVIRPELEEQFHASAGEIKRAVAVRGGDLQRRALRSQKHALQAAVMEGNLSTVRRLLVNPSVLIECHTRDGVTPLGLAASVGNGPLAGILLDLGADVCACDRVGASPLMMAALKGHAGVVGQILESKQGGTLGRDYLVRHTTKHGETAVIAAAKAGHVPVLEALATAGAETGALCTCAGSNGVDALMMAARHDRLPALQWLLSRGLTPARTDGAGRDVLMHAAGCGSRQVVTFLLTLQPPAGPDLGALDKSGRGSLYHACLGGDVSVVEMLQAKGAAPGSLQALQSPHPEGDALLAAACAAGHEEVVELLLKAKVGTGRLLLDGSSHPLFAAVAGGRSNVVDVLMAAGSRIDVRDDRGRTPLACAAARGQADMVEKLVAHGASMLAMDNHGRVPRQLAQRAHQLASAQMLSDCARVRYVGAEDTPPEQGLAAAWGGPKERWPAAGMQGTGGGLPSGVAAVHAPAGGKLRDAAAHGRARYGWGHNAGDVRWRDSASWAEPPARLVYADQLASSGKNRFRGRTAEVTWLPTTI
ncbi:hypothetical protein FOA52_007835 [Chlamydomonas sp. UWO 241]|nr:hypothetical protein FOA52_007835 [Chlamydomonas sp. UWO 241]